MTPDGMDLHLRAFTRALIDDVRALERMLAAGIIESGVRRIGAEQEIFLVDAGCEPAPVAAEVLARLDDPSFKHELALFNLEANLPPLPLRGDCMRRLEDDLTAAIAKARSAAQACGAEVLLTGILPTLQLSDLGIENLTPRPRYQALNELLRQQRGGAFEAHVKGIDELFVTHDNVMLEACNTSFQIHFQVGAQEFADLYNLAQAVTAPVLAAAVNSPVLLEHRLWHETRIALFQHSIDHRSSIHQLRGQRPRVRFGDRWITSVLDIFRDDIARFRVLFPCAPEESPLEMLDRGEVPRLKALCLHNGSVYRWNRPCYGVCDGRPHLRIENRALPAGPTIRDEVANAAFYNGLMSALSREYGDITRVLDFDDAKANFLAAARHGLRAQFAWVKGRTASASDLILTHLLPLARAGLVAHDVDLADADLYLGVIEERVKSGRTGAQWALDSITALGNQGTRHDRCRALAAASLARQRQNEPVHTWPLAAIGDAQDWRHGYKTVGQFMTRDLFTVRPDDVVDLAANLMDWQHIRHVPVEDDAGRLVGLISHRLLLRHLARVARGGAPVPVSEIMRTDPVTVKPSTPTIEAIELMRASKVSCLPVVQGDKLVGIVTERDLIVVSAKLLEEQLRSFRKT